MRGIDFNESEDFGFKEDFERTVGGLAESSVDVEDVVGLTTFRPTKGRRRRVLADVSLNNFLRNIRCLVLQCIF